MYDNPLVRADDELGYTEPVAFRSAWSGGIKVQGAFGQEERENGETSNPGFVPKQEERWWD